MFSLKKLMFTFLLGQLLLVILPRGLYAQSLVWIASYDSLQGGIDVTLDGNYAYITDVVRGLIILDIGNPATPLFQGAFNTPLAEYDTAIRNGLAYIGAGISEPYMGGFYIVDVANPSNPTLLSSITSFPWEVIELEVVDDYAYLETYGNSYIIDIHDASAPHIDTTFNPPGFVSDFYFDSLLFTASWSAGFTIFNINNPLDPQVVGRCETPGWATAIALNRAVPGYAFIAGLESGLQTINISTLSNPVISGNIILPSRARDVALTRYYAFAATDSGLVVVDISDPTTPVIVTSSNLAPSAMGLAIKDGYIFVACNESLQIFRFIPPTCSYIPGDVNGNNIANGLDVIYLLNYFKGGHMPLVQCDSCPQSAPFFAAADVNGSCAVNSVDITYYAGFLRGERSLRYCVDCPPDSL